MTLLLFYIKSSTIEAIERQLEICITKAMKWTTKNRFTILADKMLQCIYVIAIAHFVAILF